MFLGFSFCRLKFPREFRLYAVWQQIQTYTVTYNGNGHTGGTAPTDSNSPYNTGATVTVLGNIGNLTKNNSTFKGWNTNQTQANNGTIQYTQGQTFTINTNTTFYAVWQATPTYFTVAYNGNGHTSGSVPTDSGQYQTGASVTVKANTGNLAKTNYVFLGWATSSAVTTPIYAVSGSSVVPSLFSMGSANVTLYAIWSSSSGGFDGGVISNSLEIKCKFPPLLGTWVDVSAWMSELPGGLPDYSAFLRFTNVNVPPVLSTDIYGITFKDENNNNVAGIGINDSLLVRKNLYAKKAGIGTLEVPTSLQVGTVESFTGQPIKVKAVTLPNADDKWVDVLPLRFSMASTPTQYDDFTVLQIGRGGLQFLDTGGLLTVTPTQDGFPTILGTAPEYELEAGRQDGRVNLFCSIVNFLDRTTKNHDPVLVVDKAFFIEKDVQTFGFVGTYSDPQKGTGGGAIMMGQGFIGKYCPPELALNGTMIVDDIRAKQRYVYGTGPFPASPIQNQCYYRTDLKELY